MTTNETPAPRSPFTMIRHDLRARLLTVTRVEDLSPRMRRITFSGDLAGFASDAPDDHVKVLFPAAGSDRPVLPSFGARGPEFPPDAVRPTMRDYTPRSFDVARGELVLDFVIHGEGPASMWAAQAQPGAQLGIAGPRGSRVLARAFDAYLIVCDETGLPAAARWIEWAPASAPMTVLAEVGSAADEIALPSRAGSTVCWLHRGAGESLLDALRGLPLPAGRTWAWIACESSQMRALRAYLVDERGWSRDHLYGAGYWKHGVADHDDEH